MIKLVKILQEIDKTASYKIKMPYSTAKKISDDVVKILKDNGFKGIVVCGSIRRKKPEIGDVDIICKGDLSKLNNIKEFKIIRGGKESYTFIYNGQQVNLYKYDDSYYGAMLFYLTGPQQYQIAYRQLAKKKGYKLSQFGLFDKNNKFIAGKTEEEIYEKLGKQWKSPELRGLNTNESTYIGKLKKRDKKVLDKSKLMFGREIQINL